MLPPGSSALALDEQIHMYPLPLSSSFCTLLICFPEAFFFPDCRSSNFSTLLSKETQTLCHHLKNHLSAYSLTTLPINRSSVVCPGTNEVTPTCCVLHDTQDAAVGTWRDGPLALLLGHGLRRGGWNVKAGLGMPACVASFVWSNPKSSQGLETPD